MQGQRGLAHGGERRRRPRPRGTSSGSRDGATGGDAGRCCPSFGGGKDQESGENEGDAAWGQQRFRVPARLTSAAAGSEGRRRPRPPPRPAGAAAPRAGRWLRARPAPLPPPPPPVTRRCCSQDGGGCRASVSGGSGSAPGGLAASGSGRRRDEARPRSQPVVVRSAGLQTPWRGLSRSRFWSISPGQWVAGPRAGWAVRGAAAAGTGPAPAGGERLPGPGAARGGGTGLRSARGGWSGSRLLGAAVGGSGVSGCCCGAVRRWQPREWHLGPWRGGRRRRGGSQRPPDASVLPAWRGRELPSESPSGSGRLPAGQAMPAPTARRGAEPGGGCRGSGPAASPGGWRRSPSAWGAHGACGAPHGAARGGENVCREERGKERGRSPNAVVIQRGRGVYTGRPRSLADGGGGARPVSSQVGWWHRGPRTRRWGR